MGLTKDQQAALDRCMSGRNVFITGGGGVGKTYLIKQIVKTMSDAGRTVMLTAPTGRAAQLIGGATCHRAFKIPLKMAWDKKPRSDNCSHLCAADTVIIDEISMVRMDVFGYIFRCLEEADSVRSQKGKDPVQLIVVGDFFQLPPVLVTPKDGSLGDADLMAKHYGQDIGGGYAFQAPEWEKCHFAVCNLQEVVRQSDRAMVGMLNRLRYGDASVLREIEDTAREEPYPSDAENVVYLCGKNKTADVINREALNRLPGPGRTYRSVVEGTVTDSDKPVPDRLHLRLGAHVMMLVNSDSYVNGSTGIITHLGEDYVEVRLNNAAQSEVTVEYTYWEVTTYEKAADDSVRLVVIGRYGQLPLRPAYAITVHRSQGQTIENAVLCVGKAGSEIFTEGQLYVGASRIKDLRNLYIKGDLQDVKHLASPKVIQYYESLGIDMALPAVPEASVPAKTESPQNTEPEKQPPKTKKIPKKKRRPRRETTGKGAAETAGKEEKNVKIAVTPLQKPVIIAYARVFDPGAHIDGSFVVVSKGCSDAVMDFLNKI